MATYEEMLKTGYQQSADVAKYKQQLDNAMANKPAGYNSAYSTQLNSLYDQISNRKPFQYSLNGDMLYQQYKDQYTQLGKRAMQDTIGQGAALTGGYGNTYAQSAGQQAYNQYLQQLNDRIPEFYDRAKSAYDDDGTKLLQQYQIAFDRDNTDYGRYRDAVSDYYDDLSMYYNLFSGERTFDYNMWNDRLNQLKPKGGSGGGIKSSDENPFSDTTVKAKTYLENTPYAYTIQSQYSDIQQRDAILAAMKSEGITSYTQDAARYLYELQSKKNVSSAVTGSVAAALRKNK